MVIDKEFVRVGGFVGLTLGVGLFLGAGYTGSRAYQEVTNCDKKTVECSQDTIDAYQKSGDASTLPFWSGIGIAALSGVAIEFGDRS